jgi:hypothetical protein
MINQLFGDIQQHLSMLDLALKSSEQIKNHAGREELDGVVNETENRERIINIVTELQRKIENSINILDASAVTAEDINILKSWFSDLSNWSERMLALDRETVELLGQQKENTTKEIAMIFRNKEVFKSYNHGAKK